MSALSIFSASADFEVCSAAASEEEAAFFTAVFPINADAEHDTPDKPKADRGKLIEVARDVGDDVAEKKKSEPDVNVFHIASYDNAITVSQHIHIKNTICI